MHPIRELILVGVDGGHVHVWVDVQLPDSSEGSERSM